MRVRNLRELAPQFQGEDLFQRLPQGLGTAHSVKAFQGGIPGFDFAFQVAGQHAGVDGFDDVLAEIAQGLVVLGLQFQRFIEARVLQCDGNIAGEGLEKINVFAGKIVALARLAQSQVAERPFLNLERQVVVQLEMLNGFLGRRRKAVGPLHAIEEEVALAKLGTVRVEETRIRLAGNNHAARADQAEAIRLRGQEHGQAVNSQGLRQAVTNLLQQAIKVQYGSKLTRELQQRAPVIVALALEKAIQPLLEVVHDGLEENGSENNCHNPGAAAGDGKRGAEEIREESDQSEIETHDAGRGQGISNASAENNIHIHQPIAHDGIAKSHGQEEQRERRSVHPGVGDKPQEIGQGIKRREGNNREPGAPCDPFQLVFQQRICGASISVVERQSAGKKVRPQVEQLGAVQHPPDLQKRQGKHQHIRRHQGVNRPQ